MSDQPVWQALPEYPIGHTHTLEVHVPPFWQVVEPHLFLQLEMTTALKIPKVTNVENSM